jgi:hypothetical protein
MSWYTDRPDAVAAAAARPWLPRSLAAGDDGWHGAEPPAAPPLAFDEGEMARMAAAMSLRAREAAQAACTADPATQLARAMERLADGLTEAHRRQAQDDGAAIRRTIALAAAIARAAGPAGGDAQALAGRVGAMLAELDGPSAAKLVVAPAAADGLRPLLPELAARARLTGGLELETDPRLPAGAVQLLWPGGWLEHDPDAVAKRVAEILAAHAPTPPTAIDGSEHEHDPA